MPTIFSRIISGELPGRIVWSDDRVAAFLTIAPLTPGHTLVVPRAEVEEWTELDPELAAHVFAVAHTIGRALKKAFDAPRVGLVVAGFEVPHAHVHVFRPGRWPTSTSPAPTRTRAPRTWTPTTSASSTPCPRVEPARRPL